MGVDKSALPFGGETMLARISRLLGEIATEITVVGRRDQEGVTVYDAVEDQGPLSGLAAGLGASHRELNVVVACDMPLVKPAVLQRLVDAIGDHEACVAVADGHASALCAVYRTTVAGEAHALLASGERRVMRLLDRIDTKRVDAALLRDLDPDLVTFVSVDTAEKYQWALARTSP